MLIHLDEKFSAMIEWHPSITIARIEHFARMLDINGDGQGIIWAWIDGTFTRTCRPGEDQRRFYSGYKKRHGIKWQGIVSPDGLIFSLAGPWPGEINDNRMVLESGLEARLRAV